MFSVVAAKIQIAKTETTMVGNPAISQYLVPTQVGISGSNYHPVGTTLTTARLRRRVGQVAQTRNNPHVVHWSLLCINK